MFTHTKKVGFWVNILFVEVACSPFVYMGFITKVQTQAVKHVMEYTIHKSHTFVTVKS